MNFHPTPALPPRRRAFTLVELLVVVAIVAVVSGGVMMTYGRRTTDEAKDKMTLHEMGEIKKAFLRFRDDNYRRLQQPIVGHAGANFPRTEFTGDFKVGHPSDARLEREMEFYETYGLWFLMLPKIYNVPYNDDPDTSGNQHRFPVFEAYDALAGEGWNGPYLDAESRAEWTLDGIDFPQIKGKHGDTYRLLYYTHRVNSGADEVIYRRLLLVAPRGSADWDEIKAGELLDYTGNLRGGGDEGRLNLKTGSFENRLVRGEDDTTSSPFFIVELLNMDLVRR